MSTKHRADGTWKKSRRGKYNAKGERYEGIYFHSQAELVRYKQLVGMQKAGKIRRLELQPKFPISINGVGVCVYTADFRYEAMTPMGRSLGVMVEDVKGHITDFYALKRKLYEAYYRTHLYEIRGRNMLAYEGLNGLESERLNEPPLRRPRPR